MRDDPVIEPMSKADVGCEVFAALMKTPRTVRDLVDMTGASHYIVESWLEALERAGVVGQIAGHMAKGKPVRRYEVNPYPFTQREPAYIGPVKRVYVAGPMAGMPELNFPAFNGAAATLRSCGLEVVNPAELNVGIEGNWAACMRNDVRELATCDTVALLPGWERSRGAQVENRLARDLGLRVVSYGDLLVALGRDGVGVKGGCLPPAAELLMALGRGA